MNGTPLPKAGLKEIMLWLLGRRRRVRVAGDSMEPLLKEGDEVFIDRSKGTADDIVVARHPFIRDHLLIKKIESVQSGRVILRGANPERSSDSRIFGSVPEWTIVGRATSRLAE